MGQTGKQHNSNRSVFMTCRCLRPPPAIAPSHWPSGARQDRSQGRQAISTNAADDQVCNGAHGGCCGQGVRWVLGAWLPGRGQGDLLGGVWLGETGGMTAF